MLKNLANRWTWPGTVVHDTIEGLLKRRLEGGGQGALGFAEAADPDEIIETATQGMRDQWVESRPGRLPPAAQEVLRPRGARV